MRAILVNDFLIGVMNQRQRQRQCRELAALKRQQTFTKVLKGMVELCQADQPINFQSVVKASGVSKSWLYQEAEIKSLIKSAAQISQIA